MPLEISLFPRGQIASLKLRNTSSADVIDNLIVGVEANFPLQRGALIKLKECGLRQIRPSVEHDFYLGSFISILESNPDAEIYVSANYEVRGHKQREFITFYLSDYMDTEIIDPPIVNELKILDERFEKITKVLEKLCQHAETLRQATDGTGLRLSQRTIKALQNQDQRFDPQEFGWEGYRIILNISNEGALKLHRVFGFLGGREKRKVLYREISEELRIKFEKAFKVDLDD